MVSYYGQYDEGSEIPQDEESQEQQPTLEMGEEGYNYSESDRTAERQRFVPAMTLPEAPTEALRLLMTAEPTRSGRSACGGGSG